MSKRRFFVRAVTGLLGILTGLVMGTPAYGEEARALTIIHFTDPFAYCAAVGTIDAPDSRYTGLKVPETIARGLQKAFGVPPTAPLAPFLEHSFWRCMAGKVYACTVGANLPCQDKADTRRTPNIGMIKFCQANPGADQIPSVASGRTTIYAWRCTKGSPTIVREVAQPDAQGFLSSIWYEIPPR